MLDVQQEQFVMPFVQHGTMWARDPLCLGSCGSSLVATANQAWPGANRAIYVPFRLLSRVTITTLTVINGATVSGNMDAGIYNADGTRLTSTGSIAQAGAAAVQVYNFADVTIGPGLYFIGFASSSATAQLTALVGAGYVRPLGVFQEASAFPLPASATFATIASNYVPHFALSVSGPRGDAALSFPMAPHITPWSIEASGATAILAAGGTGLAGVADRAWTTANQSIAYPFVLSERTRIRCLWCRNGATLSGNIDMGIYGDTATKIISTGSIAQAGVSLFQAAAVDVTLGPGRFYFALAASSATATFSGSLVDGTFATAMLHGTTANFPLGAAIPVNAGAPFVPVAGPSRYTFV